MSLTLIEEPFEVCRECSDPGCANDECSGIYVLATLTICPVCDAHDAYGVLEHELDCQFSAWQNNLTKVLTSLEKNDLRAAKSRLEALLGRGKDTHLTASDSIGRSVR